MLWAILTITAVTLMAASNILEKYIVSWRTKSPSSTMLFFGVVNVLYAAIIYFVFNIHLELGFVNVIAIMSGMLIAVFMLTRINTLSKEEVSRVVPLISTSPLLVAIFARIVLQEKFSHWVYVGVVLIVLGGLLLSFRFKEGLPKRLPVLGLIALMLFIISTNSILVKWAQLTLNFPTFIFYDTLGFAIVIMPLWLYSKLRRTFIAEFVKQPRNLRWLLLLEVFSASGGFMIYYALSLGSATLVIALAGLGPLILLVLSMIVHKINPTLIKDEFSKKILIQKASAIALIIIGVWLIL